MKAKNALYINADKTALADEGSVEAAYLLVGPGGDVSAEDIKKYGIKKGDLVEDDASLAAAENEQDPPPDTEGKALSSPPENKAAKVIKKGK